MIEPHMNKPPLFRRAVMNTVWLWRRIMSLKYNPIGKIPDPSLQTYFMLVLFTIWSVWFGFLASSYLGWFGYNTVASIIIHAAILVPLAMTNAIFIDAERDGHKWLKEWKEEQNRWTIITNRLKTKNLTIWDPSKEA
jgi:hypothetical protein